jgi:Spy/CpxP family protein refolding chaperone
MSRFVAAAAAIALVVSGVLIGGLGTFLLMSRHPGYGDFRPPPPMPPPPRGPFTRDMESRLELSEDQMKQIRAILDESRDQADAIRRELRPRLESHLEATRTRIAALLTPAQRSKFEELVKQDQRRAERFFLDGPPGPPPQGPPYP